MVILVTGGAGYIGSHCCVELLQAGHEVVVVDNLSNASAESLRRVERITGRGLWFEQADVRDATILQRLFAARRIDAVMHFAGLKAVGESVARPLDYYDNNVQGTLVLCRVMAAAGCHRLVFSSSATVYGMTARMPLDEQAPLQPANPYGRSKWMVELLLRDLAAADNRWRVALLRYFNPVGAHVSGLIGEDPRGVPNNLVPYIAQVAIGRRPRLQVFGADYATPDGTGVRDYIHVVDLARGHLSALRALEGPPGVLTVNLGTGRGYSVLEMVRAFERASGRPVPYDIVARRPGDTAICYADTRLAAERLGWRAELDIDRLCEDTWRWQKRNPCGYADEMTSEGDNQ
ncbi:MAG: UDP-glucose 4-epimerase GalE [Desulfuromonas thiophila]|nr:UDP-glucose 4-epimerase GalE [Desulfuromonas thiophila]